MRAELCIKSFKIFKKTTLDFVMKKMKYPENNIIKLGYFPASAKGIDEEFCFVNLDMDIYMPMLSGLRFFWDSLVAPSYFVKVYETMIEVYSKMIEQYRCQ